MKLKEVFNVISNTAKETGASKPYIVGGMVRDILLSRLGDIKDIDITCGDSSSDKLGLALVKKFPQATYTKFSDGHGRLKFDKFYMDFSNNYNVNGIEKLVPIKNPTELQKEMFSRDFTVNALLMPLDLSKVHDVTSKGLKDLRDKKIDTCLDPAISLGNDPRRIVRVIYLCAKLEFSPADRVSSWIIKNKNVSAGIQQKYALDRLNSAMKYSPSITTNLAKQFGFESFLDESSLAMREMADNPELLLGVMNG